MSNSPWDRHNFIRGLHRVADIAAAAATSSASRVHLRFKGLEQLGPPLPPFVPPPPFQPPPSLSSSLPPPSLPLPPPCPFLPPSHSPSLPSRGAPRLL